MENNKWTEYKDENIGQNVYTSFFEKAYKSEPQIKTIIEFKTMEKWIDYVVIYELPIFEQKPFNEWLNKQGRIIDANGSGSFNCAYKRDYDLWREMVCYKAQLFDALYTLHRSE